MIAFTSLIAYTDTMASITIRNLDDDLKARLRIQAAKRQRSMEEEAREILRAALGEQPEKHLGLGEAIHRRFAHLGGIALPDIPRDAPREPPPFDR